MFLECQIIPNEIFVIPKREISILVNFAECCLRDPCNLMAALSTSSRGLQRYCTMGYTLYITYMQNFGFFSKNIIKNKIIEDRETNKSMPIPVPLTVPLIECSCVKILLKKGTSRNFGETLAIWLTSAPAYIWRLNVVLSPQL